MQNFNHPKIYLAPMSINLMNNILNFKKYNFGLIISRRQIDHNGGYVNNLNTKKFYLACRPKNYNKNITICRDHGGPYQGYKKDQGIKSFIDDFKYLDILHIDPFKKYSSINQVTNYIHKIIYLSNKNNYRGLFEIGTEKSIFQYSPNYLNLLLNSLYKELNLIDFKKIKYCVTQSGTSIDIIKQKNTSKLNLTHLKNYIKIIKKNDKLSKEHNGDYLTQEEIQVRFQSGLDAINIAPEIIQIENQLMYEFLVSNNNYHGSLISIIKKSNIWKKWLKFSTNPLLNDKTLFISFAHYFYKNKAYKKFINYLPENFYIDLKRRMNNKLNMLSSTCF